MMIPPSDPIAMSDAIRSYLLDPFKGEAQGGNGRRRIESSFTMESMVAGYLDVYDTVLLGRSKVAPAVEPGMAINRVH